MRPPPVSTTDNRTGKVALFLEPAEIRWIVCALGALPRDVRRKLERSIDQQLAQHGDFLN